MRWFIRRLLKKGKDQVSYEEDIHFGQVLSIGRGTDQAIYLPDMRAALAHARVTVVGQRRYKVESLIIAGIRVDGDIVQEAIVAPGARIEIGSLLLKLGEPPEDCDAAVEVSTLDRSEQRVRAASKALPTTLAQTWLSRRRPSWLLFLLVLGLGFLLPVASHFNQSLDNTLRATPLPALTAWESGELASAHHRLGVNCQTCHVEPFVSVRDQECVACHAKTPAHADPQQFNLPELATSTCAHCHRDHNGPDGLILTAQTLCSDCHVNLSERTAGASSLGDASDFGQHHPQFMIELPAWNDVGDFAPVRVSMDDGDALVENSGLTFPHDVHLAAEGINSPDGRQVLQCNSCHLSDAGGGLMQAVNFESTCQDCHKLGFDTLYPDRQVPHGNAAEVIFALDTFYSRRALEGGYEDQTAPTIVRQRRRPGQTVTREEQNQLLTWARERAKRTAENLFTGQACLTCHQVSEGVGEEEPWLIAPVRVAGVWLPKHEFSHRKHTTMECADCHAADLSASSSDVLMPEISSCRQCHGGEDSKTLLQSTCVDCHGFHQSEHLLQGETSTRSHPELSATEG